MRRLASVLIAVTACQKPSADTRSEPAHAHEVPHEAPSHVTVSPRVRADARIEVAVVTKAPFPTALTLPGEIVADPNKLARVASPAAGRVERVAANEGQAVRKGDVVIVLKVPELGKVRSGHAGAAAKSKAARSNADRLKALADKELGSRQAALDAEAEASALESEATATAEQLAGMGVSDGAGYELLLRAPINGVVTARNAVVGQPVSAQEALATIAQLDEVWFAARVFEKDLGELRQNAPADVQLNAFPKERFSGSVDYIGRQVDPVSRTLTARIKLENPQGLLRLGLFGHAQIELTGVVDSTLSVPSSAVTEIAGHTVVFVEQADGDFVRHDVVLGQKSVGRVEVVAGLREGERLAVSGVLSLKSLFLEHGDQEGE